MFSAVALTISLCGVAALAAPAPPSTLSGGQGLNSTPEYVSMSDYDFQSLNLGLNQEYLELFLFQDGLDKFSAQEFEDAGLTPEDQSLVEYMRLQEVGHAEFLTNILGANASKPCNYSFPFNTVQEFISLSQKVTRVGESAAYGFLEHLDSRAVGSVLGQAIAVEGRQQMAFRQFAGLFPFPFWFIPTITQSMAWTLGAGFITSCPSSNPKVEWQLFPSLNATTGSNGTINGTAPVPAITTNATALTTPGQSVNLSWELPGKQAGPDLAYNTTTLAGEPKFAAWISQLNVTYTPLTNVTNTSATTTQPNTQIYGEDSIQIVNGTVFVLVTDSDLFLTPYNLSLIDPHVVAGPALYGAG